MAQIDAPPADGHRPSLAAGDLLAGRYRVVSFLGEGAVGEVYEADDLELGEPVAVKVLRPEISRDEQVLHRFRREIQLARKVTHPNVCRVFDLVHHPAGPAEPAGEGGGAGRLLLTMELLRGETLEQRLTREGRLSPEEALPIVRQIAAALGAAHAAGVVHRDLKSSNVFLVSSPAGQRTVVTDFGLAWSAAQPDGASATLTATGQLLGSPAYMAPEQVRGEAATPATDIYALGVVMFEMVTGELPFLGQSAFYTALLRLQQPAPSPRTRVPDLDPAWEAVILCCLEREPAERFRQAHHVVRALGVTQTEDATAGYLPARSYRRRRWERARPALTLGLAALAAAIALVSIFLDRAGPGAGAPAGTGKAASVQRTAVAVLPFENLSGRPQNAYLGASLFQMLPTELAAANGLRPLAVEEVDRARKDLAVAAAANLSAASLKRLRGRLGAELVVTGAYLVTDGGRSARFDVLVQDTGTGETVAAFSQTGREGDFLSILADLGEELRQRLGQTPLAPAEAEALRALRPHNAESARLYTEGLTSLRASEPARARDLLLQAVALDPENPLVRSALASAWSEVGYDVQARQEAKRALELSSGLDPESRLLIDARRREMERDWDGAARVYRDLWALSPDEVEHGLKLAAAENGAERHREALATLERLERMPEAANAIGRIRLAEAQAAKGLSDFQRQRRAALAAATAGRSSGSPILVAESLIHQGDAAAALGEFPAALEALERAARLFAAAGHRAGIAQALRTRGVVLDKQGDLAGAAAAYREALTVHRELGQEFGVAACMHNLGNLDFRQGRTAQAKSQFEAALVIFRRVGRKDAAAGALNNLGAVAELEGDLPGYEAKLREARALYREVGNRDAEARTLLNFAGLAFHRGDLPAAVRHLDEALAIYRVVGNRSGMAQALQDLGGIRLHSGDLAAAERTLTEALKLHRELGEARNQAQEILTLAGLALERGDTRAAESKARQALTVFQKDDLADQEAEALLLLARCRLVAGDPAIAARMAAEAERIVRMSENSSLLLLAQTIEARILAARGRPREAVELARRTVAEAQERRFVVQELEARLALGEAEILAGDAAAGRRHLEELERTARDRGFGLLAGKAARAAAASPDR